MKFISFEHPQIQNAKQAFEAAQANFTRLEACGESHLRSGRLPVMFAREWDMACADLRKARRDYLLSQQDW